MAETEDLTTIRQQRGEAWRKAQADSSRANASPEVERETAQTDEGVRESVDITREEQRTCRICLDDDEDDETGKLFSPCRCTGSMRFVHPRCLDTWRANSSNDQSYFRCDACHFEYRMERVKWAEMIMSTGFQQALTLLSFLLGALVLGISCQSLRPDFLPRFSFWLQLPPKISAFFMQHTSEGNPACFEHGFPYSNPRSGLTYEFCCRNDDREWRACWDDKHSFDTCCTNSEVVLHLQAFVAPAVRVLASGTVGLSLIGFSLYLWRQIKSHWGDQDGWFHGMMSAAWFASLSHSELGRIAVFVGAAVALRELFETFSVQAKLIARKMGDRVLEVS